MAKLTIETLFCLQRGPKHVHTNNSFFTLTCRATTSLPMSNVNIGVTVSKRRVFNYGCVYSRTVIAIDWSLGLD